MTYCDNPTLDPNTNGLNYNYVWDQQLVPVGESIIYPCQDQHNHEGQLDFKHEAANETEVECGSDGVFQYPTTWPQCSETIHCVDPGNSSGVSRKYMTDITNLEYLSVLQYRCDDRRKWIRNSDVSFLSWDVQIMCQWRKVYNKTMTDLICEIHHCRHPHDEPGSHDPPSPENNLILTEDFGYNIQFGEQIKYECPPGMYFENDEIDPTQTRIDVECLDAVGEYNTPIRQGHSWPNCTKTVLCGKPPDPPTNGTRTWISPASEDQETYNTHIVYTCQDGSQFDTDNDGRGDSVSVEIRCQWNKQWNPYTVLPPCLVTHCVEPFKIPPESNLEEISSSWTEVNTYKHYQCKNSIDSIPTMFWETDRTKSSFKLYCNPDGYFTWQDWPTCLTGKN